MASSDRSIRRGHTIQRGDVLQALPEAVPKHYVETALSKIPARPDEIAEVQALEFLKYISIMSMTGGRRIAVTPEVDDIWHEFIVQTVSYRRLCNALPAPRFIHHESITPKAYESRVGSDEFAEEFLKWIPDYTHSFGPFTEKRGKHWTVFNFLKDTVGLSLDQINETGLQSPSEAAIPESSPWRQLGEFDSIFDLYR